MTKSDWIVSGCFVALVFLIIAYFIAISWALWWKD